MYSFLLWKLHTLFYLHLVSLYPSQHPHNNFLKRDKEEDILKEICGRIWLSCSENSKKHSVFCTSAIFDRHTLLEVFVNILNVWSLKVTYTFAYKKRTFLYIDEWYVSEKVSVNCILSNL